MSIAERWKGHPPLPEDLEDRLGNAVERLRRAGADLVYVFGSAAPVAGGGDGGRAERVADLGGRPRPPGDLDLAVLGLDEDVSSLRADLADILGTDRLDLVRLERADPELRFGVVARGRLLHARDPGRENEFEERVLREYRDLAPFRRVQWNYLRARHGIGGP